MIANIFQQIIGTVFVKTFYYIRTTAITKKLFHEKVFVFLAIPFFICL